jgi:16S rRNA (cytidine1402-2'-O)-methyltransferase
MSGTLFVVATPVGNLEDVTLRALRVLREVDVIAAEDTRRTANLLAANAIRTPTLSFHQHNLKTRIPQVLARLQAGQRIALVTDAGTPGVSDPGVELVSACIRANLTVEPVPGASAPLVAAIASGFPLVPLTIFGFPPRRGSDRTRWFEQAASTSHTFTFFESPRRLARTLTEAGTFWGTRQIIVARELTKRHQEFLRGTADSLISSIGEVRGEVTVVVGVADDDTREIVLEDSARLDEAVRQFFHSTKLMGLSRREAVRAAAIDHGLSAKRVYEAVERAKKSGV